MANNSTLITVFQKVCDELNSRDEHNFPKYVVLSDDFDLRDYCDWGMSYDTTAQSIIESMIEEGDIILAANFVYTRECLEKDGVVTEF